MKRNIRKIFYSLAVNRLVTFIFSFDLCLLLSKSRYFASLIRFIENVRVKREEVINVEGEGRRKSV